VNVLGNEIGIEQAQVLAAILKEHPTLKSLCGHKGDETELNMSGKKIGVEGAIMLAPEIVDNGALSSANLLKNHIPVEQAQELEKIMRAKQNLTTLCCGLSGKETELDFSGQDLEAGDAVLIANDIKDNGALSVVNVMGNNTGKEQLTSLQEIMRSKPNLVSLCGIADDANEADLSGLGMDADDAAILASELPDKGALSSLNLASNYLGQLTLPEGWEEHTKSKGNFRLNGGKWTQLVPAGAKAEGIIALAGAIPDMRALSLLNLTDNSIGKVRVQKFKEMCGSRHISLLIN
jgi:hypothetical protein